MTAYYNEFDPRAAAWLRELIKAELIAPGEVDERSIEDVIPTDLDGFTQCHFFAGIGGWSYALRLAGWPDDKPVWTGSCPCQPFSAAGKGGGFADERHLWPAFFHLISQCRPPVVFGEQVASPPGLAWLDLVQTDLEGQGYAVGAADLCAAGVGAPHIRQRLYWVAHSDHKRRGEEGKARASVRAGGESATSGVAHSDIACGQHRAYAGAMGAAQSGGQGTKPALGERGEATSDSCDAGEPGYPSSSRAGGNTGTACSPEESVSGARHPDGRCDNASVAASAARDTADANNAGPQGRGERRDSTNQRSAWESSLVGCRDGKWRPVEPGTFPLAHGVPGRVGLLRGYGNAIVPQVAQAFIEAVM